MADDICGTFGPLSRILLNSLDILVDEEVQRKK